MTQFLMGSKPVNYIREGHQGDRGYNPSKPRMVLIEVPGSGQRLVPFDHLTVVKEEEPDAPVRTRRRR